MALNQAIDGRWHPNIPVPAAVVPGMPIIAGGDMVGVVLAVQPINTPSSPLTATIDTGEDCYYLQVNASTTESPITGSAILPGQKLYATGTTDATTGVTYNLTIDKNAANVFFGWALDSLASGQSGQIRVKLKG